MNKYDQITEACPFILMYAEITFKQKKVPTFVLTNKSFTKKIKYIVKIYKTIVCATYPNKLKEYCKNFIARSDQLTKLSETAIKAMDDGQKRLHNTD